MKTTLLAILLVFALLLYGCAGASQNPPAAAGATPVPTANQLAQSPPAASGGTQPAPGGAQNPTPPAPPAGASGSPAVKQFTIEASDWQFSPDTITVNKGDIVKITLVNKDVSHGIFIQDFGFDLKAGAGETATGQFSANKTGTFGFRCNVFCGEGHRNMTGTLIVR